MALAQRRARSEEISVREVQFSKVIIGFRHCLPYLPILVAVSLHCCVRVTINKFIVLAPVVQRVDSTIQRIS